ncbi:MAG: carboxypeptidase regulatory-like domain-containing protein, partial [Proteobacteria bacterium]|nr:carboxypeptidase regulatory-like domain-containing protein [Pseudomonadota bacterium]
MRHQVMTNQTWRLALAASAFLSVAVAVAWDASGRIEALWPVRNVIAHDVAGILTAVVPMDIQSADTGSLRGTVHDDGGRPVPRATVLVAMPDGSVTEARTLADGTWTLTGIPVGRHPVWIGAP